MNDLLDLMRAFEERNNISIYFVWCSDGSCSIEEFWTEEVLAECDSIIDVMEFLRNTQYELDSDGRCFSPVRLKKNEVC